MATPFDMTLDTTISLAIQTAGGMPTNQEEYSRAVTLTNLMFVDWSNKNINLWKLEYVEVPVTAGTLDVALDADIIRPVFLAIDYANVGRDIPLVQIGYNNYLALPKKEQEGRTTQVLLERLKDNINLKLWYVPDEDSTLKMWVLKHQDTASNIFQTTDVPTRFLPALYAGLAYAIGLARNDGSENWARKLGPLKQEADEKFAAAVEADSDSVDFVIRPMRKV